jgi:hypothetical protein
MDKLAHNQGAGRERHGLLVLRHVACSPVLRAAMCESMVPCLQPAGMARLGRRGPQGSRGEGEEAGEWVLACGNCGYGLRHDYMCPHVCRNGKCVAVPASAVPTDPGSPGSRRCLLCGEMTSRTKPHRCRGLSTVVYDLSNMPEHGDPSLWSASEMDRVRELAGGAGVFVHVFVYQGHVLCHTLVVAPSGLEGAGSGAFTLMGLQVRGLPPADYGSAHRAAGAWRAAPTRNLLGIYNGVVVPKGADATDDVPRLAALKVMRVRGFACGVSPPQATRKSYAAS